jgi:hypothetical protein
MTKDPISLFLEIGASKNLENLQDMVCLQTLVLGGQPRVRLDLEEIGGPELERALSSLSAKNC